MYGNIVTNVFSGGQQRKCPDHKASRWHFIITHFSLPFPLPTSTVSSPVSLFPHIQYPQRPHDLINLLNQTHWSPLLYVALCLNQSACRHDGCSERPSQEIDRTVRPRQAAAEAPWSFWVWILVWQLGIWALHDYFIASYSVCCVCALCRKSPYETNSLTLILIHSSIVGK